VDESTELTFWSSAGRANEEARSFRDADTIEINSESLASLIWQRVSPLLARHSIFFATEDNTEEAEEEESSATVEEKPPRWEWDRELQGTWMPSALNHDLLFARYPSGGAFSPHTDGRAIHNFNTRSFQSVIIFLNTLPQGGEGEEDGEGAGGGTRFYQRDVLKNLVKKSNSSGKEHWTCSDEDAERLLTLEVAPKAGRMLFFNQALVHEGVPPLFGHLKYIIRSDVMYTRTPAICDSEKDVQAYNLYQQAEALGELGQVAESIKLFRSAFSMSPALAVLVGQR